MQKSDITTQMVNDGDVLVYVCGMANDDEGSTLASSFVPARVIEFYDVMLVPSHDELRGDGTSDPFEEHENLTLGQAMKALAKLQSEFPNIDVEWI